MDWKTCAACGVRQPEALLTDGRCVNTSQCADNRQRTMRDIAELFVGLVGISQAVTGWQKRTATIELEKGRRGHGAPTLVEATKYLRDLDAEINTLIDTLIEQADDPKTPYCTVDIKKLREPCIESGEMLMLGLPPLTEIEVRLANIVIAALNAADVFGIDLTHALCAKHVYNGHKGSSADEEVKAGGYGPCPLEGCNRLMPHEHGQSSFTAAGQTSTPLGTITAPTFAVHLSQDLNLEESDALMVAVALLAKVGNVSVIGAPKIDYFATPGNAWETPADAPPGAVALKMPEADPTLTTFEGTAPFEHVLRIAEAVKSGKTMSYVEAAKVLADFVLERQARLTEMSDALFDCPKVVCLCGSTRFGDAFAKANLDETLAGNIILTVGCFTHSDAELGLDECGKAALDELHKRKIDLCDEVLVLNVKACVHCKKLESADNLCCLGVKPLPCNFQPYIGDSTRSEIAYAEKLGKPVRYLNPAVKP